LPLLANIPCDLVKFFGGDHEPTHSSRRF
jgi:hypothetical protein